MPRQEKIKVLRSKGAKPPPTEPPAETDPPGIESQPLPVRVLPVVGIGASAGEGAAFRRFFPADGQEAVELCRCARRGKRLQKQDVFRYRAGDDRWGG